MKCLLLSSEDHSILSEWHLESSNNSEWLKSLMELSLCRIGMEKIKQQTRNRVARHREKQKNLALGGNVTCNVTVTESNATEEENKIRKDKDKNITTTSSSGNILELFQSEFRRLLSGFEIEEINHLINENNSELIKEALRTAVNLGKPNVKYIGGILRNWQQNQVTTVEQVRQTEKQRKDKKIEEEVNDEWGF